MHNNVVKAVAQAYRDQGYSTLRFNFRGVKIVKGIMTMEGRAARRPRSAPVPDPTGERQKSLAGYSFGAWVNALGIDAFKEVGRLIMVSPPVSFIDFSFLGYSSENQADYLRNQG